MKTFIYSLAFSILFLAACTNNKNKTQTIAEKKEPATEVLGAYLKLKNAFTTDNDKDAAAAGKELVTAFAAFDKKSLTAEQSKTYADIEADAKEHGEHIGDNIGNITHQREHFDLLSKDMYDLVKLIGANQTLYVDHCPMYNNNKGAIWLSEVKDIKNPYLGKAMPTCGTIQEELKQ